MLKFLVAAGLSFFLLSQADPAAATTFQPCADAATLPGLAGSLCTVARVPLEASAAKRAEEIDLFVRKFPADDRRRRRGEVWLIAGGPGEPGASFYPVLATFRRTFRDYDLVIPDHRGTGYSTKLCPREEAPDGPDGIALAGDEWGPCIAALHSDPARTRAFTITNAAHDLSTLITTYRRPGEVYVYGVSYGTQLILRMMQAAPPKIDGIVLDGLVPPEADAQWDLSHRTEIVDSVGRALLTPAQTAQYRALLAHQAPRWVSTVPGGDLRRFMAGLLTFPDLRRRIPDVIEGLSRDDDQQLVRSVQDLRDRGAELSRYPQSPPSLPLVILISGSENNDRRSLTKEIVAQEAEGALFTSPLPGFLVDSPVPLYARDGLFGRNPVQLPRTLIVHGTLDPNTSYEGARAQKTLLSVAGEVHFTTIERGAHFLALVAPDCFERAVSAFVRRRPALERCATAD
ncbi:alpha/beta fold hydrolase [Allosphingosinicella deserti]|uniref:Alpha/beta hydrolase n=1 Tax=Allosphingosinicella deserti TaxID=2116704 RepID=A0A2P7QI81_9SPHN|nr:alpha/beta hydrolase [Sphingomonas deserti]PSJ37650.1 alpha/beta hydrolase [Sphingomonas deserti]